jgi:hypothetical protein
LGTIRGFAASRALFLIAITLSIALSAYLDVRPVSAYISNLTVSPSSVTTQSGNITQTIGFAVSVTYSGCWGICEATWFGAVGSAPFVDSYLTRTGCSMANYNTFWWSGTCIITIFLYVNHGGVTPPGTYYPTFYVYAYSPRYFITNVTLIVT